MGVRDNGADLGRPAAAWVNKPACGAVRHANAPSRLSSLATPGAPAQPRKRALRAFGNQPRPSRPARPVKIDPIVVRKRARASMGSVLSRRRTFVHLPSPAGALGFARSIGQAGVAFAASAIAVLALAALIFPRPLGPAASTPSAVGVTRAPESSEASESAGAEPAGDSPVSAVAGIVAPGLVSSSGPASLGSIRIPAIELDAAYYSGVHDAVVELGPGHWPGTPLPGAAGNAVFAGHRTTHTHPFRDLDLLKPGDLIQATSGPEPATDFLVDSVEIVAESSYVDYVLAAPEAPDATAITLFACTPKGSASHRIVVRATEVPRSVEGGDA